MARNVNLSGGNHEGMQVSQIGQKEDLFRRDVHLQRTLHQLVLFEHREFSVLAPIHLIQVENRMKQKWCVHEMIYLSINLLLPQTFCVQLMLFLPLLHLSLCFLCVRERLQV